MIAPAAWREALAPLVAERSKELAVELVALETIARTEDGVDLPERVKRFLHRAWKERGARYALLVGDADTFPVRFMLLDRVTKSAFDHAFYASDLYYADVAREDGSFDDWNAAKDGVHARYFGEVHGEKNKDGPIDLDRISYVPELAVGRWPVSSEVDLRAVVAKTLAWRPAEERGSALLVHAAGWVDERARVASAAEALEHAGFAVERQLYADGVAAPDVASVLASAHAGRALVLHAGHGSADGWHGCLAGVDALRDAPPAVYASAGCSTATLVNEPPYMAYLDEHGVLHRGTNAGETFDAPPPAPACIQPAACNATSVGEELVRSPTGGAVAYVGCVTGAQPCAVTLIDGFARAFAEDPSARVGDAWRAAVERYWGVEHLATLVPDAGWYPPSIFFQGMKFVLLGDPTLRLVERRGRGDAITTPARARSSR